MKTLLFLLLSLLPLQALECQKVGEYAHRGYFQQVINHHNHLYAIDSRGLLSLQASDEKIAILDDYEIRGFPSALRANDSKLFVGTYWGVLHILDASDPSQITPSQELRLSFGNIRHIFIADDTLYVSTHKGVVTLAQKDNRYQLLSKTELKECSAKKGLLFEGKLLEMCSQKNRIDILTIEHNAHPSLLSSIHFDKRLKEMIVTNDGLVVAQGDSLLLLRHFSSQPIPIYKCEEEITSLFSTQHRLYITTSSMIIELDSTDLAHPRLIKKGTLSFTPKGLTIQDGTIYTISQTDGVSILDPDLKLTKSFFETGNTKSILIFDPIAILLSEMGGVKILDISEKTEPKLLTTIPKRDVRRALYEEKRLYLLRSSGIVEIYDLTQPAHPTLLSQTSIPGGAKDIYKKGDHLFLLSNKITILDISNPATPSLLDDTSIPISGYARRLIGTHDVLYLLTSNKLLIIDITDIHAPRQLQELDIPSSYIYHAKIHDSTLTLVAGYDGLLRFDISNPKAPKPLPLIKKEGYLFTDVIYCEGRALALSSMNTFSLYDVQDASFLTSFIIPTNVYFDELHYDGRYLYLANTYAGMRIMECDCIDVEEKIVGKRFEIEGFFIKYGKGAFDWLYLSVDARTMAKLEGVDERGYFRYTMITPDDHLQATIDPRHWRVTFSQPASTDTQHPTIVSKLFGKSFEIGGFFIKYGTKAFDWLYVTNDGKTLAKLNGADEHGYFDYTPLDTKKLRTTIDTKRWSVRFDEL